MINSNVDVKLKMAKIPLTKNKREMMISERAIILPLWNLSASQPVNGESIIDIPSPNPITKLPLKTLSVSFRDHHIKE